MLDRMTKYIFDFCQSVPTGLVLGFWYFCLGTVLLLAFVGSKKGLKLSMGFGVAGLADLIDSNLPDRQVGKDVRPCSFLALSGRSGRWA